MAAEILGGALALMTLIALHGALKLRRYEADRRWMLDAVKAAEGERDDLSKQNDLLKSSNRALNDINKDLRDELDRTHADLRAQMEIAASNVADAMKWRAKLDNLRRIASSGGKAAKAKRDAKKAETTEKLKAEVQVAPAYLDPPRSVSVSCKDAPGVLHNG